MNRRTPILRLRNFGPIREGELAVKPLTILIGPNSSGKSYVAQLIYAICQVLTGRFDPAYMFRVFPGRRGYLFGRGTPSLRRRSMAQTIERRDPLSTMLPPESLNAIQQRISDIRRRMENQISEALREYFACTSLDRLITLGTKEGGLSVELLAQNRAIPFLTIEIPITSAQVVVRVVEPDIRSIIAEDQSVFDDLLDYGIVSEALEARLQRERLVSFVARYAWEKQLHSVGLTHTAAYYLPPGRSGLIYGWQTLAGMAVRIVGRRAGVMPIELPAFQGVAGDFLSVFLERGLGPERFEGNLRLGHVVSLLEKEIFQGEVQIKLPPTEAPAVIFTAGDLSLPLQAASSMIAELSPLALWLKHILDEGDLLIIDEPEAHLHPEAQRRIARVLVRLIRFGVSIISPTHSSVILHQLSNHLLAARLEAAQRRRLRFEESDVLRFDDLGVYLFKLRRDGARIERVHVDPEFGISEEEFVRVADALGRETFRLSAQLDLE